MLIDDFKVSTTCNSGTQCDTMYTGESCEFDCDDGYVPAANTSKTSTCIGDDEYSHNALKCQPMPPTIPAIESPFEVEERSKPGTFVGLPIEGITGNAEQTILWYIDPSTNNDGATKDGLGNYLPVFRIGICDGQIKVANALLDFAKKPTYRITVIGKTDGLDVAAS